MDKLEETRVLLYNNTVIPISYVPQGQDGGPEM